jgi:glycine/D-amino acid oxidase-like deaminating enzyme
MNNLKSKKIVILGAGIIGLTTASMLIEDEKELDITIIAENFDTKTTSDGAGGLFRPDDRFMPGVSQELARLWIRESFEFYDKLLFSKNGGKRSSLMQNKLFLNITFSC